MSRNYFLLGFLVACLPAGCQKHEDQIQTYRVSKEPGPGIPMAAPMMGSNAGPMAGSVASPKEIEWKVPAGWQEQAPSSMRMGSFLVRGSSGQTADVSVIPLSGDAGGDLANINRWRGQINLGPLSEAELPQQSQTLNAGGRAMRWVDFVSTEPLVDGKYPKRLIAAIYLQGTRSWFFKMMGEDKTVEDAKPAFLSFLKSLRFHGE